MKREFPQCTSRYFSLSIEKKCNYHPNDAFNKSSVAEQTLIRTIRSISMLIRLIFFFHIGMIRTMLSFSIIHLLLVIVTFICGLYSIRDYRYTYKRLAGMLYILTGNIHIGIAIEFSFFFLFK